MIETEQQLNYDLICFGMCLNINEDIVDLLLLIEMKLRVSK